MSPDAASTSTRCDLHVHSSASRGHDEWFTRQFGCPESYADPITQYELCKARGMSLVTLTDHDTIDGGLRLIDRPDFFLSEEVTTRFPENGVVIHALVWNITPEQHEAIQHVRHDIYRLIDYVQYQQIAHACAHPLLSPSWNLDAPTLEKLLLLFPALEVVNGLTDSRIQNDLEKIIAGLDAGAIARMSVAHSIEARGAVPWRKARTAGSDDHVHRRNGVVYTEVAGILQSPHAFLEQVMAGGGRACGEPATLTDHLLSISHTTYHFMKVAASEQPDFANPFMDMVDVIAGRELGAAPRAFVRSLVASAMNANLAIGPPLDIASTPQMPSTEADARVFDAITRLCDGLVDRALDNLSTGIADGDFYRVFGVAGDFAGAATVIAPLMFACDHFGKTEAQVRRIRRAWTAYPLPPKPDRLALFSDTSDQINGVTRSCQRFIEQARIAGKQVLLPDLPIAHTFETSLYSGMRLQLPSVVSTLEWVWRNNVTHVELATPGPMGVVGLLAAKLLHLPVTASYHTEVPELIRSLSGSEWLGKAAAGYCAWFYNAVDRVFAFSSASRDRLIELGVRQPDIEILPVAVDPITFSPAHRRADMFEAIDVPARDRPVILSVGRLSREKNLPMVIEAIAALQHLEPAPILVIVGDGPERASLEGQCAGFDFVHFAGFHEEPTITGLYASARMFVFAGVLDTLGLVTLEAMSSGLPVLVPSNANVAEVVTDGVDGVHYGPDAKSLAFAIARLLCHPTHTAKLAENARNAMIERWQSARFDGVWSSMTRGST